MPSAEMQEDRDFNAPPSTNVTLFPASVIADPVRGLRPAGHLGDRADIEAELDLIAAAMRAFYGKQPDQIMRECAGYSARLTEMCVLLHRRESSDGRQVVRIRTQQVERFLKELEFQFRAASRSVEMLRLDMDLLK